MSPLPVRVDILSPLPGRVDILSPIPSPVFQVSAVLGDGDALAREPGLLLAMLAACRATGGPKPKTQPLIFFFITLKPRIEIQT